MLTARGRCILGLGLGVYVAAWAFGSKPLYPVATGLLLVVVAAWIWVRLANRPYRVQRGWGDSEHVEGDSVPVIVELEVSASVPPAAATLVERIGRLGEIRHGLRRNGRRLSVRYVLRGLPRGRYTFDDVKLELSDPFGLESVSISLPPPGALLVYPRLVLLERLFSETGMHSHDGRRLLLRRHSGFELHGVREYEQGESLRRVHWRSTARRGQLMVKELEDASRDEIAVLLDADASVVVGESFDMQVRVAGSILESYVRRGRRAVLVVNSEQSDVQQVHAPAADWRRALELLAAVEPNGRSSVARLLGQQDGPASRALELAVVTARLEPELVDRLVQRSVSRRKVSLVHVDAGSFNGAQRRPEPLLLRLDSAGIPVVTIRAGDDLAALLEGAPMAEALHGLGRRAVGGRRFRHRRRLASLRGPALRRRPSVRARRARDPAGPCAPLVGASRRDCRSGVLRAVYCVLTAAAAHHGRGRTLRPRLSGLLRLPAPVRSAPERAHAPGRPRCDLRLQSRRRPGGRRPLRARRGDRVPRGCRLAGGGARRRQ